MQPWRVFACGAAGVIQHQVVRRIQAKIESSRYAASNRRFARSAPAADPVDVPELFPNRRTVGTLSFHGGNMRAEPSKRVACHVR
jgi:hypothetical protein